MMRLPTILAAALVCVSASLWIPARGQSAPPPASSPAKAVPRAAAPRAGALRSGTAAPAAPAAASTSGSSAPAAARAARPPPLYRVELIVFRATSALGAPEDWALEAGTAPLTSTDADPGGAEPSGTQPSGAQPSGGEPSSAPSAGTTPGAATGTTPGAATGAAQASGAPTAADPASSGAPGAVVRVLPSSELTLGAVASRLRASGRYVPVAHIGWIQTASPWGKPVEIPVQSVGLDAPGITGTVALERGVFLHLALDLRYAMPDPPAGLDAPPGTVFVLDQSHRVRLKERNYFDHPAFGVIALVTSAESSAPKR